jgi:hypothetical protein
VTQASDYPPRPFEPMTALRSEVTRTDSHGNVWGRKQRVTLEEALRVDPMELIDIPIERTMVGGRWMFES